MKRILKNLLISFAISIFCCLINVLTISTIGHAFLGISFFGGEMVGSGGFGIIHELYVPETTMDIMEQGGSSTYFSIPSFLISFILVFVIVSIVSFIWNKIKLKRKKGATV